jgi:hypothetical protein
MTLSTFLNHCLATSASSSLEYVVQPISRMPFTHWTKLIAFSDLEVRWEVPHIIPIATALTTYSRNAGSEYRLGATGGSIGGGLSPGLWLPDSSGNNTSAH